MGFFSDLKEDLSQAVNELIPADDKVEEKDVKEDTGDTDISLDEMLKNIDDFQLPEDAFTDGEVQGERVSEDEEPVSSFDESTADDVRMEQLLNQMLEGDSMEESGNVEEIPSLDFEKSFGEQKAETEETFAEEAGKTEEDGFEVPEPEETDLGHLLFAADSEKKEDIILEESEKILGTEEEKEMEIDRIASDENAVITTGMVITGDISTEGSVDIIGTVNGNIDALGKLNITGHINGNSKAAEIYAESAKINGEIVSAGAVKIGASSVIIGNITATSAAIAGAVKGDIDVKGPVILDASAIVMGNIKSKSVQINNGAVIEGMCSQCYADVSPTSFFEEYKPEGNKSKSK